MATFNFCSGIPPNSFFSDIQSLNKLSLEKFSSLTEIVISYLTYPSKTSQIMNEIDELISDTTLTPGAMRSVLKTFISLATGALKRNVAASLLQEDLKNLGLAEENAAHFIQEWTDKQLLLSRGAVSQTLVVNRLVDMEWKFGVMAASSEVDKLGSTFLQLKLVINTGSGLKNVYMELTLPQFYSFLHEMEKAKASLQYFS